jgi:hypothetical protein
MPAAPLVDLAVFIAEATPGSRFEYFRGRMDVALDAPSSTEDARRVRSLARTAAKTGYFELSQKRIAEDDYAYLIRRRSGRGSQ